ncbi:MAG: hypothetical protein A3K18_30240 [Lentisphaerae bacterium RIFOXYA12_64_32]|nr:MAG: hypothetical protein A3K18_30240 [Lentisphaerae bacterium RIFOXYA12_64_32]
MIELLMVIAIIGILTTMALPSLLSVRRDARYAAWMANKKSNSTDVRCVAYYTFEDGYGSKADNMAMAGTVESSFGAEEFNGTVLSNGAPCSSQWTKGRFRKKNSLFFDGANVCVDCGNSKGWNTLFKDAVTIETWVYPQSLNWNCIFSREWGLALVGSMWGTMAYLGNGAAAWGWAQTEAAPTEQWTHVAMVYNGETVTMYINGEVRNSGWNPSNYSGGVSYCFQEQNATIGATSFGGGMHGNYWHGIIDEVAIFKEALDPGEIQAKYDQGRWK